jgi:hypothetical protein
MGEAWRPLALSAVPGYVDSMTWRAGGIFAGVVAAVAAIALFFGGHNTSVLDPVANAADTTVHAGSAEVKISGSVTAAGQTLPLSGNGVIDMRANGGRLSMSMSVPGAGTQSFDEVVSGTTVYLRMPPALSQLPGGKKWMKIDLQKIGKSQGVDFAKVMNAGRQNPADMLRFLKAVGNSNVVGTESIGGATTTHYSGSIDLARAADRLGDAKTAAAMKQMFASGGMSTIPVDVWIDDAGRVRRERMSMTFGTGGTSGGMEMAIDFVRFGVPVDLRAPPSDQVFDASSLLNAAGG